MCLGCEFTKINYIFKYLLVNIFNYSMGQELNFIINVLFKEKSLNINEIKNIDFEKLIKIASYHLIIPLLYLKLKKYKDNLPTDFFNYIKYIYSVNLERNKILIEESKLVENILNENKIKYKFLKGTFLIRNNYYSDMGARMIGDIDFIVENKDKEFINSILNDNGYHNKYLFKLYRARHLPRYINDERVFALEPHLEILSKKNNLIEKTINKAESKNNDFNHLVNILNFQINDNASSKCTYSLKTIYDFKLLNEKKRFDAKKYFNISEIKRFFIFTNFLNITNKEISYSINDLIFLMRIKMKFKFRFYLVLENIIFKVKKIISIDILKILELIINKNYRDFKLNQFLKKI